MNDTIAALATPIGVSGVGIVRLSGPESLAIATSLWQSEHMPKRPQPRTMYFGWLVDGDTRVDQGLLVYMKAPHSYTGEDTVELQMHGSPVILQTILDIVIARGARLAEPGEFTKRAYLNNKIDLTQAEAVNNLIHAQSMAAVRSATSQLAGSLKGSIESISTALIAISAAETAYLDFGEEDIAPSTPESIIASLDTIQSQIKTLLRNSKEQALYQDGVRVAIIGLPNAGKSTLLNTLLGYERAIVTDVAGTTRDTIEETLMIGSIPVRLIDTAGLNTNPEKIEKIGIEKSAQALKGADCILLLIEPNHSEQTESYLKEAHLRELLNATNTIVVHTKADIAKEKNIFSEFTNIHISAKDHRSIQALKELFTKFVTSEAIVHEGSGVANSRQLQLLTRAHDSIAAAHACLKHNQPRDVMLVEIDSAIDALNELSGTDISSAKLAEMFANFCIGK